MIRAVLLELDSELSNFTSEFIELLLDVSSLLVLKGKNSFLYWSKSLLADFDELSLTVLEFHNEILLHLNSVLLEKHYGLFHGINFIEGAVFDHLYVSEVSHHLHEDLLLALGFRSFRDDFDSVRNLIDELLNVCDLSNCVVE